MNRANTPLLNVLNTIRSLCVILSGTLHFVRGQAPWSEESRFVAKFWDASLRFAPFSMTFFTFIATGLLESR